MSTQPENKNYLNRCWTAKMTFPTRSQLERPSVLVEAIYTMPNWIVRDDAFKQKFSKTQISKMCQVVQKKQSGREKAVLKLLPMSEEVTFRLAGNELPKIVAIDAQSQKPLSKSKLKRISLKRKTKAHWRRELMVAVAKVCLQTAETQSFLDEDNRFNLLKIVDDPVVAEAEALEIWNRFIDECEVPSNFLVSTRSPLSLYELMAIRNGNVPEIRQEFANKNPWAARSILSSNKRNKQFRKIDANSANSIKVASKHICCRNSAFCHPARKLTATLSRNQNLAIGQLDDILDDLIYREILVSSHDADRDIISHIGKNVNLAKRQIYWADEVYYPYTKLVTNHSEFAPLNLSALLFRMMVRDGYEPDEQFCPETIVKAVLAVALDSLAVFCPGQSNGESPFHIDTGVAAFVYFIGKKKPPLLTMHQFIEFANQASLHFQQPASYQVLDSIWPAPKAWDSTIKNRLNSIGVNAQVITDKRGLCRTYHSVFCEHFIYYSAVLGELVILLIDAADKQKATLTLQPIYNDDNTTILDWKEDKLEVDGREEPSSSCKFAVAEILKHFQTQCPNKLSQKELSRKSRIQRPRSRWNEVYSKYLPRIFSQSDPKSIFAEYWSDIHSRSNKLCKIDWEVTL